MPTSVPTQAEFDEAVASLLARVVVLEARVAKLEGGPPPPPGDELTITLTASPPTIEAGQKSTLAWCSNGDSVELLFLGAVVGPNGTQDVFPTATTDYRVKASKKGSADVSASAVVTVSGSPPPPPPPPDPQPAGRLDIPDFSNDPGAELVTGPQEFDRIDPDVPAGPINVAPGERADLGGQQILTTGILAAGEVDVGEGSPEAGPGFRPVADMPAPDGSNWGTVDSDGWWK